MFDKVLNMPMNWLPKLRMFHSQIKLNMKGNRQPSTRKNQKERTKRTCNS